MFLKSSKVQLLSCETHAFVFLLFSHVQLDLLVISNGCLNPSHALLQPTPPVPLLLWSLCSHCRSVVEVRNRWAFLDLIVTQIEVNYVFILIHVYIFIFIFLDCHQISFSTVVFRVSTPSMVAAFPLLLMNSFNTHDGTLKVNSLQWFFSASLMILLDRTEWGC